MGIGEKIRVLRKSLGFTQLNLAIEIGVTPQTVGKWERGESEPDLTLLCPIAAALKVSLEELFDLESQGGLPPVFSYECFRNNMRMRRQSAGFSQTELARKLDVRSQTISKWETGACAPDLLYLREICDIYAILPTELLCGSVPAGKKKNSAPKRRFEFVRKRWLTAVCFITLLAILVPILVSNVLPSSVPPVSDNSGFPTDYPEKPKPPQPPLEPEEPPAPTEPEIPPPT